MDNTEEPQFGGGGSSIPFIDRPSEEEESSVVCLDPRMKMLGLETSSLAPLSDNRDLRQRRSNASVDRTLSYHNPLHFEVLPSCSRVLEERCSSEANFDRRSKRSGLKKGQSLVEQSATCQRWPMEGLSNSSLSLASLLSTSQRRQARNQVPALWNCLQEQRNDGDLLGMNCP